jgi:replicative DNA helicase
LEVHHRTYERIGQERSEDLTVLCDVCHGLFHERTKKALNAVSLESALVEAYDEWDARFADKSTSRIPTGFVDLDEKTTGLQKTALSAKK